MTRLPGAAARALELVLDHQDPSGAFPASPTFSAYRGFAWFRDGAFIADAVSAAGEAGAASAFHDWCARALDGWRERVADIAAALAVGGAPGEERMLPARLRLDGTEEHGDWADFQVDGYGTWLWALDEHLRRHRLDPGRWRTAVQVAVDYLVAAGTIPCYDWWEERPPGAHPATWGCVVAGLDRAVGTAWLDPGRRRRAGAVAARMRQALLAEGARRGYLPKTFGSARVDASVVALVAPLDVLAVADPLARTTLEQVERHLVVDGGTHRFLGDRYYGGGRWPLLSAMLGLAWLRLGERPRAERLWEWAVAQEDPPGRLPEQVADGLLVPEALSEWTERWGPSASPLLWSSAMVLRLAVALGRNATDGRAGPLPGPRPA